MVNALTSSGFRPLGASNLEEARAVLRSKPIQFVVTCWHFRDGTGQSLIEHLESLYPEVGFLVVSGGCPVLPPEWPFLSKPFRTAILVQCITAMCQGPKR